MPVWADDAPETETEMREGLNLMEEGARMLMRGLLDEVEPTLDSLRNSLEEMGPAFGEFMQTVGPAFGDLLERVDDLRHYEPPEILPNGDIIMRRSPDAPVWEPEPETPDQIEL